MLFHVGRVGSTVLGDQLRRVEGLTWTNELYLLHLRVLELNADRPDPPYDPLAVARTHVDRAPTPVVGFGVKFFHLDRLGTSVDELLGAIGVDTTLVVSLRRRNLLRVVVSAVQARATGAWHRPSDAAGAPTPVHLDPHAVGIDLATRPLVEILARYERGYAELDRAVATGRHLRLDYDTDIVPDPRRAARRLATEAGLTPADAPVRTGRTNPFPLDRLVANLDEIDDALAGTRWAWMTSDRGASPANSG